jgi:hypothetical protein
VPRKEGDYSDPAACSLHLLATDNLIRSPIAAFDKYVGEEPRDDLARRKVVENNDSIHALEGSENLGALVCEYDRAVFTFKLTHALIAINTNNEHISERPGLL